MLTRRTLMLGGKGGVGKTTCAAATALHCARRGERTLLISTDPTPSLADVFRVQRAPGEVLEVAERLHIVELGFPEIREMWDRKFGPEVYEVFSAFVAISYEEFVEFITSILPGLAEEFMVDYVRELCQAGTYDRIIWDTAPLGQTLELLRVPRLLREHLRPAPRIYSRFRLGERSRRPLLEIIRGWEELSQLDLDFLRREVGFVMVLIPEALAVQQLERAFQELGRSGLTVHGLIVNGVVRPEEAVSEFWRRRAEQQRRYLEFVRRSYGDLAVRVVPLFAEEPTGVDRLERVRAALFG